MTVRLLVCTSKMSLIPDMYWNTEYISKIADDDGRSVISLGILMTDKLVDGERARELVS